MSRTDWPLVPLKRLATINERTLPEDTDPDLEFRYVDISSVGRGELISAPLSMRFGDAPSRARRRVRPGDTIVSTVRTYLRAIWPVQPPTADLVVSTGFAVLSPGDELKPRFFAWWLQADPFVEEVVARSVGVSYPAINPAELGSVGVPVPPLSTQQVIAAYLDVETRRIDALIFRKRRSIQLLRERFAATREEMLVRAPDVVMTPLMHLTDPYRPIVYGIVQAGPEIDGGVPYIKTGDLTDPELQGLSRTAPEIDEQYRRARVRPGDIVIAMRASIGLTVMIPETLPTANLTQGTARIAAASGVSPRWLLHALRTSAVQEQCIVRAVGTTFKTLNIWDLRRLQVPVPTVRTQDLLAEEIDAREERLNNTVCQLNRQIELLREHRQALITAAVTGEIEAPGVAA